MMRSKKSLGYSPKYGVSPGPLMKVWKMVKKILPFFGTCPFLRIPSGSILTRASSSNAEKALYAWSAKLFLSARKRILGRLFGSFELFHFVWKSFQEIWKAMAVFPVPVARVRRILCLFSAIAESTAFTAFS